VASYRIYNINTKQQHSLLAGDPQLQNVVWNPVTYQVAYPQKKAGCGFFVFCFLFFVFCFLFLINGYIRV
jgi:hypothetical protein